MSNSTQSLNEQEEIQSLKEENQRLVKHIEYLEVISAEYHQLQRLSHQNPNFRIIDYIMMRNEQDDLANRERQRRAREDSQRKEEEDRLAAEQKILNEKVVEQRLKLESWKADQLDVIIGFFNASEKDFQEYMLHSVTFALLESQNGETEVKTVHETTLENSPVGRLIKKSVYGLYSCKVCKIDETGSISSVEEHIYRSQQNHKPALLQLVDSEFENKVVEAAKQSIESDRQIDVEVRKAQAQRHKQAKEVRIARVKAAKLDNHIRRYIQ